MRLQTEDVYLLGGNDGKDWLDGVELLMPACNGWRDAPPMPLERGYGGAVSVEGSVYVMGGGNGTAWLNSMVRLDCRQSWQLVIYPSITIIPSIGRFIGAGHCLCDSSDFTAV